MRCPLAKAMGAWPLAFEPGRRLRAPRKTPGDWPTIAAIIDDEEPHIPPQARAAVTRKTE